MVDFEVSAVFCGAIFVVIARVERSVEIINFCSFFHLSSNGFVDFVLGVRIAIKSRRPVESFCGEIPFGIVIELVVGEVILPTIGNFEELGNVYGNLGACREGNFDSGVERFTVMFQGIDGFLEIACAYVGHFIVTDNVRVV